MATTITLRNWHTECFFDTLYVYDAFTVADIRRFLCVARHNGGWVTVVFRETAHEESLRDVAFALGGRLSKNRMRKKERKALRAVGAWAYM